MLIFWYWAVIIHTSSWSWCTLINILCCFSYLSFNATLLSVTCRRKSLKLPEHLLAATALEQEKYKVVNYWHHNFSMYGVLLAPTAWSDSSALHSWLSTVYFWAVVMGVRDDTRQRKILSKSKQNSSFGIFLEHIWRILRGNRCSQRSYSSKEVLYSSLVVTSPPIWLRQSTFIGLSF